MIKNSLLLTGSPMTGKTTRLQNRWVHDYNQRGYYDLAITLWNYNHTNRRYHETTIPYLSSVHGRTPALALPHDYHGWVNAITAFHNQHPAFDERGDGRKVRRIFIDEAYCLNPVLVDTLIMILRDFYKHVPVIISSIDFDSWHKKLPTIDAFEKMCAKTVHLTHQCQMPHCKNKMTRRLHLIKHGHTWKPYYDPNQYARALYRTKFHTNSRAVMISVCDDHYYLDESSLNELVKENNKLVKAQRQKRQSIRRSQAKHA